MTESLSIVLPAWNEQAVIGRLVRELDREVAAHFAQAEIVVVDDASTDGTWAVLSDLAAAHDRLRVLRSDANRGHGPSVLRGLAAAGGQWIFQLDSDGQFVVGEFWKLWERREEADLVLGVRHRRRDPLHRIVLSRVIAVVVSVLAGRRLRDPNVPFRLLRRAVWDDLRPLVGDAALAPSISIATAAAVRHWRIVEVPVTHLPRAGGASSLRTWRLVAFSLRGLAELARLRYELGRVPVRRVA